MRKGEKVNPFVYPIRRVLRIVDGDTIDVEIDAGFRLFTKIRVRVLGVDAFETRLGGGRTQVDKEKGIEAKSFTGDWVASRMADGEIMVRTEKPDAFGRILADVTAYTKISEGLYRIESLAEALIESGYDTGNRW